MIFNVGDRVKIKEDLEYDEIYGGVYVTDTMLKYRGEVAEIAEVNSNFNDRYILKDCGIYWFHKDMLEPIRDDEEYETLIKIKGKDGEIVEAKKTLRKEKTSLEKALILLNMTEEEMNREYYKREYTALAEEIARKFVDKCSNCIKCDDSCNICDVLFTIEYLKEKGLLKDEL